MSLTKVESSMIDNTANLSLAGANINLGNVGNVHITGGSSAQVLSTDGAGNLTWVDQTAPSITTARSIVNAFVFGT